MELNTLRDLYLEQLKDLYSAEQQLIESMPQMTQAASDPQLKAAFQQHAQETQTQLGRLEQIGKMMGEDLGGHLCKGTQGIIEEGKEVLKARADSDPEVIDAALITSAQRVEHYEIAGYGTTVAYAKQLGETDAVALLQTSLDEEGEANKKLTAIALSTVNPHAGQA